MNASISESCTVSGVELRHYTQDGVDQFNLRLVSASFPKFLKGRFVGPSKVEQQFFRRVWDRLGKRLQRRGVDVAEFIARTGGYGVLHGFGRVTRDEFTAAVEAVK